MEDCRLGKKREGRSQKSEGAGRRVTRIHWPLQIVDGRLQIGEEEGRQKAEVRRQKLEGRSQKAEGAGRRVMRIHRPWGIVDGRLQVGEEGTSQKTESRSQKLEGRSPKEQAGDVTVSIGQCKLQVAL